MTKFSDAGTTAAASYAVPGISVVYKPSGGAFGTTFKDKLANTGWSLDINDANGPSNVGTLEKFDIIEEVCNRC